MRSPPPDLVPELVRAELAERWLLHAAAMEYVPEGGGSHHWKLIDADGQPYFVTVDDLDDKDWLGEVRELVFEGLKRAMRTAAALRHEAGLEFVVAPIADRDGELVRRIDDRHAVSVFPFLAGRSHPFGPHNDAGLRRRALDMIAALHRCTAAVRDRAPSHEPRFGGRRDLEAFLEHPDQPWADGPFSATARHLFAEHATDLVQLTRAFDQLVDRTRLARANPVITHGEPHPANLMSVRGRLVLIDWDTTALAPPERDLALILTPGDDDADRYQQATGRELDPAVISLYRLRWYLDDIASAARLFRNSHRDTPDTRRWLAELAPALAQLPTWQGLLGCG